MFAELTEYFVETVGGAYGGVTCTESSVTGNGNPTRPVRCHLA